MADPLRQLRFGIYALGRSSTYGLPAILITCSTHFSPLIASHGKITVLTDHNYHIPQLLLLVFMLSIAEVPKGTQKGPCKLRKWKICFLQSCYLLFFESEKLVPWGLFGRTLAAFKKNLLYNESSIMNWTET